MGFETQNASIGRGRAWRSYLGVLVFVIALINIGAARGWAALVNFGVPALPADWFSIPWSQGGTATISGGSLAVDGARVGTNSVYGPGRSLVFVGSFSGDAWQHVGFGTDYTV